jgi:transcriptional antiterminator RfaH
MALRWYLIRTQPRAEYQSAAELDRDGLEIFFPRVKTSQPRAWHEDSPLFPGYLFVRFDTEKSGWPMMRPSHRTAGWVNFEGFVPDVPDEVVNALATSVGQLNSGHGLWEQFKRGDEVWVSNGNLEGLGEVIQEAKSPQARAKVLLQFMGRLVKAEVPWESLQPVGSNNDIKTYSGRRTRGRGRWTNRSGPRRGLIDEKRMMPAGS